MGRLLLSALLLSLPLQIFAEEAGSQSDTSITLEVAPLDLGELRSSGLILLASESGGGEIYTFDVGRSELRRFSETGASWGDPLVLLDTGRSSLPAITAMAVSEGIVALMGGEGVYLFDSDGAMKAQKRLFMPGGLAPSRDGWAVSLVNLPHPAKPGRFLARGEFGDEVPRVILLDDDLEILEAGLIVGEESVSASSAAGRQLYLAASPRQIYAAERANYRVFELDRSLASRGMFRDPELMLEGGLETTGSESQGHSQIKARVERTRKRRGEELASSTATQPNRYADPAGTSFRYQPVIEAAAWDSTLDQLVLLLADGIADQRAALDFVDPLTGVVRRIGVASPPGSGAEGALNQLAIGKRYIWIRARRGEQPTLRLRSIDLMDRGETFELPESPMRGGQAGR